MQERVAYLNGKTLPESRALLNFRDNGFVYGDAVFDTARTFNGEIFRLDAHMDRLYRTLDYVRIDPGIEKAELARVTREIAAANRPLLREHEDYWVSQRISSGVRSLDGEPPLQVGATVVVECTPLPLRGRARMYIDGISAVVASRPRIAPEALSPNAKTNNYLNMMLAQREVNTHSPGAWALMPDRDGNLAEGPGSNLFLVVNGELITPTTEYVLAGVSRDVTLELAQAAGIKIHERAISAADAKQADEAFFTSTSLCICPINRLDDYAYPAGVPGPLTHRLMDAFSDLVGMDYVEQYTRHATAEAAVAGL